MYGAGLGDNPFQFSAGLNQREVNIGLGLASTWWPAMYGPRSEKLGSLL